MNNDFILRRYKIDRNILGPLRARLGVLKVLLENFEAGSSCGLQSLYLIKFFEGGGCNYYVRGGVHDVDLHFRLRIYTGAQI